MFRYDDDENEYENNRRRILIILCFVFMLTFLFPIKSFAIAPVHSADQIREALINSTDIFDTIIAHPEYDFIVSVDTPFNASSYPQYTRYTVRISVSNNSLFYVNSNGSALNGSAVGNYLKQFSSFIWLYDDTGILENGNSSLGKYKSGDLEAFISGLTPNISDSDVYITTPSQDGTKDSTAKYSEMDFSYVLYSDLPLVDENGEVIEDEKGLAPEIPSNFVKKTPTAVRRMLSNYTEYYDLMDMPFFNESWFIALSSITFPSENVASYNFNVGYNSGGSPFYYNSSGNDNVGSERSYSFSILWDINKDTYISDDFNLSSLVSVNTTGSYNDAQVIARDSLSGTTSYSKMDKTYIFLITTKFVDNDGVNSDYGAGEMINAVPSFDIVSPSPNQKVNSWFTEFKLNIKIPKGYYKNFDINNYSINVFVDGYGIDEYHDEIYKKLDYGVRHRSVNLTNDYYIIDITYWIELPFGEHSYFFRLPVGDTTIGSYVVVNRLTGFVDEDGDGLDDRTGQPNKNDRLSDNSYYTDADGNTIVNGKPITVNPDGSIDFDKLVDTNVFLSLTKGIMGLGAVFQICFFFLPADYVALGCAAILAWIVLAFLKR